MKQAIKIISAIILSLALLAGFFAGAVSISARTLEKTLTRRTSVFLFRKAWQTAMPTR